MCVPGTQEAVQAALAAEEPQRGLSRRAALAAGRHVAGFVGYDACYGLEGRLMPLARRSGGAPLFWFGLFDGFRELKSAEVEALLGDPAAAWIEVGAAALAACHGGVWLQSR